MFSKVVDWSVFVLVVVGGINWGLVGAFGFNAVDFLLGGFPLVVRAVYVLVGVSALYMAYHRFKK